MVKIGEKLLKEFGIVSDIVVTSPQVDIKKIQVPGRDGELDLSTALTGEPVYKNRTITIKLAIREYDLIKVRKMLDEINNYIHGKEHKIVIMDNPSFFYKGRCSISENRKNRARTDVTITVDAYPYKLKNDITEITKTVNGQQSVICHNLRKSVVPKIITTAPFELQFNGKNITISKSGTFIEPNIKFLEGENTVLCKGTGSITFQYQEGSL